MITQRKIFFTICTVFILVLNAQSQWVNRTPDNIIRNYNAVYMVDSLTGWVGGGPGGSILKTTNGGDAWSLQYSTGVDQDQVREIKFIDKSTGFALGTSSPNGFCLKTTDGGSTWNHVSSLYSAIEDSGYSLINLAVTTSHGTTTISLLCWSYNGTPPAIHTPTYYSTDKGSTWNAFTKYPVASSQIYKVVFPAPSTGLLLASNSIYRTSNGGNTWQQYRIDSSGANVFSGIRFLNADTGYFIAIRNQNIFSQPCLIGWTFNRGETWALDSTQAFKPSSSPPEVVYFLNRNIGFALQWSPNSLFRTNDAGMTWLKCESPSPIPLYDVHTADGKTVVAAGNAGRIIVSKDSGGTWLDLTPPEKIQLTYVKYLSPNLLMALGNGDLLFLSTDSSKTWTKHAMPTGLNVHIAFGDSLNGWIADDSSRIYHSTNSGRTWTLQTGNARNPPLYGIHFFDDNIGCAVGAAGFITATADGGTWKSRNSNTSKNLYSVFIASRTRGWAVGQAGTIITTSDGCNNWSAQASPASTALRSAMFSDTLTGYILGDNGTFLKTTNGGATWNSTSSPSASLNAMKFISADEGWVVGDSGKIFTTLDGSRKWMSEESGTLSSLKSIDFANSRYGVVVGENGVVLATANGGIVTQVDYAALVPASAELDQNYPNPFNPTTVIGYQLQANSFVTLEVYDVLGREVSTLVNERETAGKHTVMFNAGKLPTGVYFYRFLAGSYSNTKRLLLLK